VIHVQVEKGEPLEKALKRFRRKCQESGILSEYKKREFFEKPSEKKKRLKDEAKRKIRKKMMKQQKKQHSFYR
jgi:small subunit ribosomal protein S21